MNVNELLPGIAALDGERWAWIADCDHRWVVSNLGRVCSVKRTVVYRNGHVANYKAKLLKGVPNQGGYLVVSVTVNEKKKCCLVHSLVAASFLDNPHGYGLVLHKNGDCTDNRECNLYYGTQKQNMADSIAHGTKAKGATHGMVKIDEHSVKKIRKLSVTHKQRDIARMFGLGQSQVHRIIARQSWAHIED